MTTQTGFRIVVLTVVLWFGALLGEAVAIVVAPTAVYMDDTRPAAAVTLYNPSSDPEEISVESVFGYPATDENGRLFLHLDSVGGDRRSAVPWIQALPRRLIVPPGERRLVRLLGRPPAGTADGEYWARLVITSRGQRIPVGGTRDSTQVQVGLDLEVRTIISVAYRKGDVTTSVSVEDFAPEIRGDTLVLQPDFVRGGEAAYIGHMELRLLDGDDAEVRTWTEQVAVYREYRRRYTYDVADLEPGTYRVVLRLSTDRDDIPAENRLSTEPVELTAEVVKR